MVSVKVLVIITITEVSSLATAFGDNIEEHNKHCKRTEANRGSRRNRICRFPFKFDGVMYDTCTDAKVFHNFLLFIVLLPL